VAPRAPYLMVLVPTEKQSRWRDPLAEFENGHALRGLENVHIAVEFVERTREQKLKVAHF
jgi:hypothetical protein